VRLIDQDNRQVGIVSTVEALTMARQVNLDLVEVAPESTPSVCRIMDFGKWKYTQKKKDHRAKVKQHQVVLKEIRLRPKIEEHDKQVKIKKAREFLEKHSKVQFTMLFRGREMAHKDLAEALFKEIIEELQDVGKPESPLRFQGRRLMIVMTASPQGKKASSEKKVFSEGSLPPLQESVTAGLIGKKDETSVQIPAPQPEKQEVTPIMEQRDAQTENA
jgi:translation initiation factor IF-3